MKFLFAALATLLFSCSSAFGQNVQNNFFQNNFRPNYYQNQWNSRVYGRYNSRVFIYNYRPNYYNYQRIINERRKAYYNYQYNRTGHPAFTGFLMNIYQNNR
jgi:hypothetical protein